MSATLDSAAIEFCLYLSDGESLITTVFSSTIRSGQEELLPCVACFRGPWSGSNQSMFLSIWRQAQEQVAMPIYNLCSYFKARVRVPRTSEFPVQICLASRAKTILLNVDTSVCIHNAKGWPFAWWLDKWSGVSMNICNQSHCTDPTRDRNGNQSWALWLVPGFSIFPGSTTNLDEYGNSRIETWPFRF